MEAKIDHHLEMEDDMIRVYDVTATEMYFRAYIRVTGNEQKAEGGKHDKSSVKPGAILSRFKFFNVDVLQ